MAKSEWRLARRDFRLDYSLLAICYSQFAPYPSRASSTALSDTRDQAAVRLRKSA
jgi:hypothetical protein